MLLFVTGSRTFSNEELLEELLEDINEESTEIKLLSGGAPGAENIAVDIGRKLDWDIYDHWKTISDWKERVGMILSFLKNSDNEKLVLILNKNSEGSNYIESVCKRENIPMKVIPIKE